MLHKNLGAGDIHTIFNWVVADLAARLALVVVASDVGKVVFVEATKDAFFLADALGPIWAPLGIPSGGTEGQVLAKVSNADYDVHWIDPPAVTPPTGDEEMAESSGVFTPKLYVSDTGVEAEVQSVQRGIWHRLGNRVFFDIRIVGQFMSGAGNFHIGNLPFDRVIPADAAGSDAQISVAVADITLIQTAATCHDVTAVLSSLGGGVVTGPVRIQPLYIGAGGNVQLPFVDDMIGEYFSASFSGSYMAAPVVV